MASRLALQAKLRAIADNVYYQPPESIKLKYPCIIYELSSIQSIKADDKRYAGLTRYIVTYIDANPDSNISIKILELPYSSHNRRFVSENLYHDVFDIYH